MAESGRVTTLADVRQDLGRVEGKLDAFITQMKVQDDRTTTLTARVDKVENRQHWYSGAAAMVGLLFGLGTAHGLKP